MKIRFYANREKPEVQEHFGTISRAAETAGLEVVEGDDFDLVVTLGGDGTILKAVHEFPEKAIFGLHLGGLGYLASVTLEDASAAFSVLKNGEFTLSERTLLEVDGGFTALNDVVVSRERSGHSALLDLYADGRFVTRYMADGLIFSTPTGSTAYSLAAGGPVLMANSRSFVVTPMNPHALGVRPLVINDGAEFQVTARSRTAGNAMTAGVYADGENVLTLEEGESVTIRKSARAAKLVELKGYDPYDVLARKLGWRGSNVK